jgi:predicted RNA binding protein YcfA (HicA-like mRNA interferase family)
MPKLPGLGQKDAVSVLEKLGYRIVRQGKHIVMSNGSTMVTIPRHTAINAFTMGNIAKTAGLTPDQFRSHL